MQFTPERDDRLVLRDDDADSRPPLAEYVFRPLDAPLESPRPYLTLRTRAGREVTAYRPADHVWHKGLSLALPVVGPHNFWGGPTYVHGEGYVQLPNNGAQVHRSFVEAESTDVDAAPDVARIQERLDWISEQGETVLVEHRSVTARPVDESTWALTWRSVMRNVSGAPLAFGSPTTEGRENAGYAGIFWRGPDDFTGGDIVAPGGVDGDAARGKAGPWLAFIAPAEAHGTSTPANTPADAAADTLADTLAETPAAGILVLDAGPGESPWFARSEEYAGLGPAPFFYDRTIVESDAELVLAAVVLVGDAGVADLAATVGADLVAEVRASSVAAPRALVRTEPRARP